MTNNLPSVFAFDEEDHLTRIHVKLALEDAGFTVSEDADTVSIHEAGPVSPAAACVPTGSTRR